MAIKLIKLRKGQTEIPLKKLSDLENYDGLEIIGGSIQELPNISERVRHLKIFIVNCPELEIFPDFVLKIDGLERLKVKNSKIKMIPMRCTKE